MSKPLIVGEANPYGGDPAMALYPLPERASGDRLCTLVMGLNRARYLSMFDRVNLCPERWSAPVARENARLICAGAHDTVVLLGSKVAGAFGLEFNPFTSGRLAKSDHQYVLLPHPSGLNRIWNQAGAFEKARATLRSAGIPL